MRYMLLIYTDETADQAGSQEDFDQTMKEYGVFGEWLSDAGIGLGGDALQSVQTATTVRVRNGETLSTDGPFAETKEQLGGFYIVDAKDLDQAIEAASRIPGAKSGSVEVRPIMEFG
jgi:hypothetical protein